MAYCIWILTKTKRGYQWTFKFTLPSSRSPAPTSILPLHPPICFHYPYRLSHLLVGFHFLNPPSASWSTTSTAIPSPPADGLPKFFLPPIVRISDPHCTLTSSDQLLDSQPTPPPANCLSQSTIAPVQRLSQLSMHFATSNPPLTAVYSYSSPALLIPRVPVARGVFSSEPMCNGQIRFYAVCRIPFK